MHASPTLMPYDACRFPSVFLEAQPTALNKLSWLMPRTGQEGLPDQPHWGARDVGESSP